MARLGATQVVSFPPVSSLAAHVAAGVAAHKHNQPSFDALAAEGVESLHRRCRAAEDAARASAAEASHARAEVLRIRQVCQQMLDATALEILQLKRELQSRDRVALNQRSETSESSAIRPSAPASRFTEIEAEIPFHEIEAALAASPLL
jgi:hypothetical protein